MEEIIDRWLWVINGKSLQKLQLIQAIQQLKPSTPILQEKSPADSNFQHAIALARAGKFEQAAACFEKIASIDPACFEACFNLGLAYDMLDEVNKAVKAYQQAVQHCPEHSRVHVAQINLSIAQRRSGKIDLAAQTIKNAVDLNPRCAPAIRVLAAVALESGDHSYAAQLERQLVTVGETWAELSYNLGVFFVNAGMAQEGHSYLKRAIKAKPELAKEYFSAPA